MRNESHHVFFSNSLLTYLDLKEGDMGVYGIAVLGTPQCPPLKMAMFTFIVQIFKVVTCMRSVYDTIDVINLEDYNKP